MQAVVYRGTDKMVVENKPKPKIIQDTDAVLRITSAAICGSDLHMYEGRTDVEQGKTFGHEIMGVIEAVGSAVQQIKVGDRVVLPFNVACGYCYNCLRGFTSACMTMDESPGAAYGYADMGPYEGGQAEYVRVPFADFNALKLPGKPFDEHEDDFLMLADIFPTAYHAAMLAKVTTGIPTAIFGAGPVGLLSVMSAKILGASDIYLVDHYKTRLDKGKEMGATPIDMNNGDPVQQIRDLRAKSPQTEALRDGESILTTGVLAGIDAVGYQSHDQDDMSKEDHTQVIDHLSELLLPTGAMGLIGVYMPADPGEKGPAAEGKYLLPLGTLWNKGITIGMGQCPVKKYNEQLRDLIIAGRANPGTIVSHHINIKDAPEYYKRFDNREEGVTKVVIQFK
ncbi:MAG: alcohol dehydrogenase [Candidatus Saccharibacteria bacterium]|nr:alcohol dehydrogenase [Candidatus Saccharibacteria bacterium]